jgi:hypothetical protein
MPKPVLTVAAAWAAFDAAVANAEKVAVRRVFYAGAQAVLDILLAGLEPTVEVTEREVDRAEALSDELRRFGEEVDAGRACPAGVRRTARIAPSNLRFWKLSAARKVATIRGLPPAVRVRQDNMSVVTSSSLGVMCPAVPGMQELRAMVELQGGE